MVVHRATQRPEAACGHRRMGPDVLWTGYALECAFSLLSLTLITSFTFTFTFTLSMYKARIRSEYEARIGT